jgi:hypothetical protein
MSQQNRYLVVQPDGKITEHTGMLSGEAIQAIVGGFFEVLPSPDGSSVFASETGKEQALPYNWLATQFLRATLHPADMVVGNVIVAGPADSEGEVTDVAPTSEARLNELRSLYHNLEGVGT